MAANTKNVGGKATTPAQEAAPKGGNKRSAYTGGTRDDKGLLTAVPTDFEWNKFKPLSKASFASIDIFMEYRASFLLHRASVMQKSAEALMHRATIVRKFGSEDTRKKAMKLDRLKTQMAELQAQLKAEGIEL